MVLFSIIFSVTSSYCIYHLVFGISFFPFMNLLIVILLIGIGADDAFILTHCWEQAKRATEEKGKLEKGKAENLTENSNQMEKESKFLKEITKITLRHAATSMFATSVTTGIAFYANIASDIIVVRCFGVMAGTTVILNYLYVVTFLPAAKIFGERWLKWQKFSKFFPVFNFFR